MYYNICKRNSKNWNALEMPTMLKFRSLQKRTVIYDKDDKRSDVEKRKRENLNK